MPEYVIIDNEKYKINTDFRNALKCNAIAQDDTIGDYERALAIIYILFGDKGLSDSKHYDKLLEYSRKFLACGENSENYNTNKEDKNELDYSKCKGLISSSFKFDYKYDPFAKEYLHWYEFYNDLANLSTSEFGTCCALNRVISILNIDLANVKDAKDKKELDTTQKQLRARYCVKHKVKHTKEQKEMAEKIYNLFNLRRE